MKNWLEDLQKSLQWLPYLVAGIETIHAEKDTETKTHMAQQALGIATAGAAQNLSPEDQQIANSVSAAINAGIVATQAAMASNKPKEPVQASTPAPEHQDAPQGQ